MRMANKARMMNGVIDPMVSELDSLSSTTIVISPMRKKQPKHGHTTISSRSCKERGEAQT